MSNSRKNQETTELLADVSHELRTPLNAVLGMLELSFTEPHSRVLHDYLATAYQSARQLVAVLDDLANLARARRGELELASAAAGWPLRAQATLGEVTKRPLNVLVVDDTLTNRKVFQTILTKRGHRVEVAGNGRQAVDRLCEQTFDVVLMDVQMPAMNGLEATRHIRDLSDRALAEVPIVAVTAQAVQDDRHRCLEAGMDEYLTKPVSVTSLISCIEFYGESGHAAAPSAALARLGGDESLLNELIGSFRIEAPPLVDTIRDGLHDSDADAVARAAHNLSGLAANFDGRPTMDAALAVERLAGAGNFRAAMPALARLESELTLLQNALEMHQRRPR
jgi:CheY-like chemotaxis protein